MYASATASPEMRWGLDLDYSVRRREKGGEFLYKRQPLFLSIQKKNPLLAPSPAPPQTSSTPLRRGLTPKNLICACCGQPRRDHSRRAQFSVPGWRRRQMRLGVAGIFPAVVPCWSQSSFWGGGGIRTEQNPRGVVLSGVAAEGLGVTVRHGTWRAAGDGLSCI